jgi:hypothetical protein
MAYEKRSVEQVSKKSGHANLSYSANAIEYKNKASRF